MLYNAPIQSPPPILEHDLANLPVLAVVTVFIQNPHSFRRVFEVVLQLNQRHRVPRRLRPHFYRLRKYVYEFVPH